MIDYPSEEFYAVAYNESDKLAFDILFPTQKRALAFLYSKALPEAWMRYLTVLDESMEKEDAE